MGEFVRLEVDEASRVGTIRLDRPPVNALNAQIQEELLEAAGEAARDQRVGAVVLWGGEKVFAAGADIKAMSERSFAEALYHPAAEFWKRLAKVKTPMIAAVSGYALGGTGVVRPPGLHPPVLGLATRSTPGRPPPLPGQGVGALRPRRQRRATGRPARLNAPAGAVATAVAAHTIRPPLPNSREGLRG